MARNKVIIDTDPGCDDVLALLFALASSPDDLEVLLISVTYGNVDVQNCLRNVLSMFHVIEKEIRWRKDHGLPEGFDILRTTRPIVAMGAKAPLGKQTLMADYYHGVDGLGNVHQTHPHHTNPEEAWKHLFEPPTPEPLSSTALKSTHSNHPPPATLFTPSHRSSTDEILHILSSNPPNTVTLIAIGPLTNFAIAASIDPKVFMRAKAVLVMGGAIDRPGNITPLGEFNCIADPAAAARVYALTSPNPSSTMPPGTHLDNYPSKEDLGNRRLNAIIFPLDITAPHTIRRDEVEAATKPLIAKGSPLAEWVGAFLDATFRRSESLYHGHEGGSAHMALHDPLCVWYALASSIDEGARGEGKPGDWQVKRDQDIRVETQGQWTRGMCVIDRRGRKMLVEEKEAEGDVSGDSGGWLSGFRGNRVGRCVGTPGARALAPLLLRTILGSSGARAL